MALERTRKKELWRLDPPPPGAAAAWSPSALSPPDLVSTEKVKTCLLAPGFMTEHKQRWQDTSRTG